MGFIKDHLLTVGEHQVDEFELDADVFSFEKGITLTHDDIKNVVTENPLKLVSQVIYGKYKNENRIDIDVYEEDTKDRVVSFTFYVDEPSKVSPQRLGLLEVLTATRFASEVVKPIIVKITNSVSPGLAELLTPYAGVKIVVEGDRGGDRPSLSTLESKPVILLSGGIDSTSLLFKNLDKGADALTFYHGQPSFTHGQWNEKKSPKTLMSIVNELRGSESELTYSKHRFKVYKHNKVWAKSFRNLFFGIHGALMYPNRKLLLGCHRDDVEHDCNEVLVKEFRELTGVPLYVPTIRKSRDELLKQLVDQTGDLYPYIYGSTQSCQLTRFYGKKHIFCGSCHSCLLRINAVKYCVDPRFSNFDTSFEVSPEELDIPIQKVWRSKKFSWTALTKWWNSLSEEQKQDFEKDIELVKGLEKGKKYTFKRTQEPPKNFILRFIGGDNPLMVRELNRFKDFGKTVFIPFAGQGREVYEFARQGKRVYSADTQFYSKCLIDGVLKGKGDTDINFNCRPTKGWLFNNSKSIGGTRLDLAQFIDGYSIKYKNNLYAKAVLAQAITNSTFRGYLDGFIVHTVEDFKPVLEDAHRRLQRYFGTCPNILHYYGSFEDLKVKNIDVVFIDPPKVVESGTDVYSKVFEPLNSILLQETAKLPTWQSEGYLARFDKLFKIPCKKLLFVYTTNVSPGIDVIEERLKGVGVMENEKKYLSGNRKDCLYTIDRTLTKAAKALTEADLPGTPGTPQAGRVKIDDVKSTSVAECITRKMRANLKRGMSRLQALLQATQDCQKPLKGPSPISSSVEKGYVPSKPLNEATLGEYSEVLQDKKEGHFQKEISEYLDAKYHEVVMITEKVPSYRANLVRYALLKLFTSEHIASVRNYHEYGDEEKCPPEYVVFSTGSENLEGLSSGVIYLNENTQFGKKLVMEVRPRFGGVMQLNLYAVDKKTAIAVLDQVRNYVNEHNFLKGKKLSAMGGFIKLSKIGWDDVVFSKEVHDKLKIYVIDYMNQMNTLEAKRLPTKRGVLFLGSPGNGKSLAGKLLANEINSTFIWVPYHDSRVDDFTYSEVFQMARELAPTIVFMEDIASQGGLDRRDHPASRDLGELLNMLDGLEENTKVMTIATENYPGLLDRALSNRPGRFDVKVEFKDPGPEQRKALLQRFLSDDVSEERIDKVVGLTEGFSAALMRELATRMIMVDEEMDDRLVEDLISTFDIE